MIALAKPSATKYMNLRCYLSRASRVVGRIVCGVLLVQHFVLLPVHQVTAAGDANAIFSISCTTGQVVKLDIPLLPVSSKQQPADLGIAKHCSYCLVSEKYGLYTAEASTLVETAHWNSIIDTFKEEHFTQVVPRNSAIRAPPIIS